MKGYEVITTLNERRAPEHQFVRWWRKEEDFLDYDLIDRFLENLSTSDDFGGIDLVTMDELWNELQRVAGERVKLVREESGDRVEWLHKGKAGIDEQVCAYCPETLMTIYDVETRGNPVD